MQGDWNLWNRQSNGVGDSEKPGKGEMNAEEGMTLYVSS
jgi:hypothetical protein